LQISDYPLLQSIGKAMNKPGVPTRQFHVVRGDADGIDAGPLAGAVVAIGNFDGVHRGHRAVIKAAQTRARELGRKAAALTFTPHPRLFLRPQDSLFQLSSEHDKLRLLAGAGLDGAVVMRFDAALAATGAEDFIRKILVGALGIGGAVIGFDFHFGKNRTGSPKFLAEEAELLGAPWFVSGEVIHGDKRGRELGFPTANLRLSPSCGLKHGIYAVRIDIAGQRHEGVASFGRRPMFDDGAPLLEVFLFEFDGNIYGKTIDVAFIGWIRHEQKFESIETLKGHMAADVAQARDSLKRAGDAFPVLGQVQR
jgi:riboflavin kinase/FMN adenylyltransferase